MDGRRWAGLQPFEWTAAATLAACLAALLWAEAPWAASSLAETLGWMARSAPLALALGVGLQALYRYADGRPLGAYVAALRRPGWWLDWLRLWLACWVVSFAYFWLKVSVPRLHGARFDGSLAALDRALHAGASPNAWAAAWPASVAGVLDAWYAVWLIGVIWCLAFFAAASERHTRAGFVHSCLLLWALGSWIYVALPAVGPAFAFPEIVGDVAGRMPRAAAAQAVLWENHQQVLAGAAAGSFQHTLGVAALPSLHVGFHVLFTLWARAVAPLLFWPFAVATLATCAGSVATGWHYAVDAYLGAALAVGCFALGRRLEGRSPA